MTNSVQRDQAMTSTIQADFDRLALATSDGWDHNNHYHNFLLRQLPEHLGMAIEVGSGKGDFARLLAVRADKVIGYDLSPEMIRIAKERSAAYPNIEFQQANVMAVDLPAADCVVSIATLHHMPLEDMLSKMKESLRPGGTLLVLDLFTMSSLGDLLVSIAAMPVDRMLKLVKNGGIKESLEARAAWAEHGKHDTYLTLREVRRVCNNMLPGAKVTRHLLWRYSIVWR